MQTARDYLVGLNLAKPGRGKFSRVGHEALAKAIGEGVKFSDYPKVAPVIASSSTGDKTTTAQPSSGIADLAPFLHPEGSYSAVEVGSGKIRGMREACRNCRQSIVACPCDIPMIVALDGSGSVAVKFVALKASA